MKQLTQFEYEDHVITIKDTPEKWGLYVEIETTNIWLEDDFVPDAWSVPVNTRDLDEAIKLAKYDVDREIWGRK